MDITKEHLARHSEQEFVNKFSMYVDSGAGLIHVRANETLRATLAVRKAVITDGGEYREWDIVNGFRQFTAENLYNHGVTGDDVIDLSSAFSQPLTTLREVAAGNTVRYYVFINPHCFMDNNPHIAQLLLMYSQMLPASNVCVILVTPDHPLPESLGQSVLSLRFEPPGLGELKESLESILGSVKDDFEQGATLTQEETERVCYIGAGMTKQQFETFASLSVVEAGRQGKVKLEVTDLIAGVNTGKMDVVNSSEILELYESGNMDSVGGMENLKDWVRKRGRCYGDEARDFGIEPPKGLVCVGPPGCQPAGSKVLMADGSWKEIEKVAVGDVVISPQHDQSNGMATVMETMAYDDRAIYRIATKGKSSISYLCSSNHILPVHVPLYDSFTQKRTMRLVELPVSDYVLTDKHFKQNATIMTCPAYDLPERTFDIHPYVIGCLLGDGAVGNYDTAYSTYNPGFTCGDGAVIKKMEKFGAMFGEKRYERGAWRMGAIGDFVNDIKGSYIFGGIAHTKSIPEEYFLGSLQQRLELLAGLIDTDGTSITFISVSKRLAEGFRSLVYSVGGRASLSLRFATCNGKGAYPFYRVNFSFGEHEPPVQCIRKKAPVRRGKFLDPTWRNFTARYVGREKVYGFTLSEGTQWYVTDNYIVTHNTGKSLLAKAISSVLGIPLVRLDFARVFNSLVGASEHRIRTALKQVESMAPVVLFIDEIDKSLGGISSGSSGDSGVSMRVLGSFLTWLQDCQHPVFTMVTANNIDGLPPEMLRRGRFDAIFATNMPTSSERREVLRIHLGARNRKIEDFSEDEVNKVIDASNKYVPAEIESAVKDGLIDAFDEGEAFTMEHVRMALARMVPLSKAFATQIEKMSKWAAENATPASASEEQKAKVVATSRNWVRISARSRK